MLVILRGVVVILGIGILTTYTGLIIGQVKCRFVHIHTMADAGWKPWGDAGRKIMGMSQLTFFIFGMGSHILAFSELFD